ncbi:MAG: hypothetical protein E7384_06065 [Ruminococcaceae bacterium]|nr:hypothetical protein [Oscillospiraceae bacterium]
MSATITKRKERLFLLVVYAVFIFGLLIVARYTSPLYLNNYGGDSAIFMMMGKSMVAGKVLYVDIFDHKGPVLFFIEAFGYLFGGKIAIFIIECIFGIITITSLYHICKLIGTKKNSFSVFSVSAVLVSGFAVFFYTFTGGNLSEEYSLPFITVCLYFMTKYVLNAEHSTEHPVWYAFLYGIAISAVFFIRLNNAVTICAGVLVIFLYLIYKKKFKNLLMNLLFGVFGVAVVTVPIVIYFTYKGALYDMIYATFLYNFKYTSASSSVSIFSNLPEYAILYLPVIISFILFFCNLIRNKFKIQLIDWVVAVSLVVNTASLILANQYSHYFTVFVPLYMFVVCIYWKFRLKDVKTYLIAVCLMLYAFKVLMFSYASVNAYYLNKSTIEVYNTVRNCLSIIPEDEKDSFIGYNLNAGYYMYGDLLPCHKYYILHDWWSKADPSINTDFLNWLEEETPVWIMTPPNEDSMSINETVQNKMSDILENHYELKDKNKYICLYRVKD